MPSLAFIVKKGISAGVACILAASIIFNSFPSSGAEHVWNNSGSTVWGTAANWTYFDSLNSEIPAGGQAGHSVPGAGATVKIMGSGHSPVYTSGETLDSVLIDPTTSGTFSTLTVNSGNSLTTRLLTVGGTGAGTGRLYIDGSTSTMTTTGAAAIASDASSKGLVELTNGATWTPRSTLTIASGSNSTGTLNIKGGSRVTYYTSSTTTVGSGSSSSGTVTISDSGSLWSSYYLNVGSGGTGKVTIGAGASASSVGTTNLGSGSTGTLELMGTNAKWTSGSLNVGNTGNGTGKGILTLDGGAIASTGTTVLGNSAGTTGEVTLTGASAQWTTGTLTVGSSGTGTVSIAGTDAQWTTGTLAVGSSGTGTVSITGTGTTWTTTGMTIGNGGTGTVTVGAGNTVGSSSVTIGGSSQGTATITGSTWTMSSTAIIGSSGTGTLNINDGAVVNSNGAATTIASNSNSTGKVTLTGENALSEASTWNTKNLTVGNSGTGTLEINSDTLVKTTGTGTVGGSYSNVNSKGTVTIAGGTWDVSSFLYVGNTGKGTITLSSDSELKTGNTAYLGVGTNGDGTVILNGGTWTSTATYDSLHVGYSRTGTLEINSGKVDTPVAMIGTTANGTGTVTLSGTGEWKTTSLTVGGAGKGVLNIQTGTSVVSTDATVGESGSLATENKVNLTGGTWTTGSLTVGSQGYGVVAISNGSTLTSNGAAIVGRIGVGNVTVTNGTWETKGTLDIGLMGEGTLTVSGSNALVKSTDISTIGTNPPLRNGEVGGEVKIEAGGKWETTVLNVGEEGIGTLTISGSSSKVTTTGVATIGSGMNGEGTVTLDGGQWDLGAGNTLIVGRAGKGTLEISGSIVTSNYQILVGMEPSGYGLIDVSKPGESWTTTNNLTVGLEGTGEIHIRKGASVRSEGDVIVGAGYGRGVVDVGDKYGKDVTENGGVGVSSKWVVTDPLMIGNSVGQGVVAVNPNGEMVAKQTITVGSDMTKNNASIGVEGGTLTAPTIVGGAGKGGQVFVVGTNANITLDQGYNAGGNLTTYFYVNSELNDVSGGTSAINVTGGQINLNGTHHIAAHGMSFQGLDSTFEIYNTGANVGYTGTYTSPDSYVVSGQATGENLVVGFSHENFPTWHYHQTFVYDPTFSDDPNHKYTGWVHVYPTSFATPSEHDIVWAHFITNGAGMLEGDVYTAFVEYINAGLKDSGYKGVVVSNNNDGITFAIDIYHFEQQGYRLIGWSTEWFNNHYGTDISLASLTHIPEPTTWIMLILGAMGLMAVRRRKK